MKMMLAWYPAADLEKAKNFYGNVLGLGKTFEMPGWAEFSHGKDAPSVGLSQNPATLGQTGATVVFQVDNIETSRRQLAGKGVEFDGVIEEIPGMVKIATFRDPFGNRLQLAQVLVGQ